MLRIQSDAIQRKKLDSDTHKHTWMLVPAGTAVDPKALPSESQVGFSLHFNLGLSAKLKRLSFSSSAVEHPVWLIN